MDTKNAKIFVQIFVHFIVQYFCLQKKHSFLCWYHSRQIKLLRILLARIINGCH